MKKEIINYLQLVRDKNPLIMNITNFVVMNNTANAVLALGASPMMIHAKSELEEAVQIADSLVINVGTLDEYWAESMIIASKIAQQTKTPWILDPVGAGISTFRNEVLKKLLENQPTVIRGNASEIVAIHTFSNPAQKGVDSTIDSDKAIESAYKIYQKTGAIVCISGNKDYIVGDKIIEVNNGNSMMTKVTGLGCSATAIIGCFLALKKDSFIESVSGVSVFSIAGELASNNSKGPGSLQLNLYDSLYHISEKEINTLMKYQFIQSK